MDDIHPADAAGRKWAEKDLSLLKRGFDSLFDGAPVMMHAVDRELSIVRVNQRWLDMLGYERREVLGRKPTDFVTKESRVRAIQDTLPHFWRVGSSRSEGYQFVKKDGNVLDILLDSEVSPVTVSDIAAYAAIRNRHDRMQWRQASTTIRALRELTGVQRKLESALGLEGSDKRDARALEVQKSFTHASEVGLVGHGLGQLVEVVQDISISLRGWLRAQEERLDATMEQQQELVLVARSISKTLAELADATAAS